MYLGINFILLKVEKKNGGDADRNQLKMRSIRFLVPGLFWIALQKLADQFLLISDIYWKIEHHLTCTSYICTAAECDHAEKSGFEWICCLYITRIIINLNNMSQYLFSGS
ncbi:PREDICTED: uncharacterized protein LOC101307968 [Fragaria vesca subsp. vesca]